MAKTIDTTPHWGVSERKLTSTAHTGDEEIHRIEYNDEENRIYITSGGDTVGISADAIPALQEILQEFYLESEG